MSRETVIEIIRTIICLVILFGTFMLLAERSNALEIYSRHPGISTNAHWRDYPTARYGDPSVWPQYNAWVGNEPVYAPTYAGTTYRLPVDSPYYHYAFVPLGNGRYQFQFALNRLQGDQYDKLFIGLNDALGADAPIDSLTAVRINLAGAYIQPRVEAHQRVLIGAGVMWAGRTNWIELNLYAHDFDWCGQTNEGNPDGLPAGVCDTDGTYDRRSYFGGEIVEYTVPGNIPYAPLVPKTGWAPYLIDWGKLIRAYPWQRPPASWDDASIVGVYVGIESIGRTYAYVQVRDLMTFGAE